MSGWTADDDDRGYIPERTPVRHHLMQHRTSTPLENARPAGYSTKKPIPMPDTSWHAQAACTGEPTRWWVPTADFEQRNSFTNPDAIRICATCPVWEPCLEWATKNNEKGYWGRKTEKQRKALRRKRRAV